MRITKSALRQIIRKVVLSEGPGDASRVLDVMRRVGVREVGTIAWETGLSRSQVRRALMQLERDGRVVKRARPATLSRRAPDEWHLVEGSLREGAMPKIVEDVLSFLSSKWRRLWIQARNEGIEALSIRDRLLLVSALEDAAAEAGYRSPGLQARAVDAALEFVTPW